MRTLNTLHFPFYLSIQLFTIFATHAHCNQSQPIFALLSADKTPQILAQNLITPQMSNFIMVEHKKSIRFFNDREVRAVWDDEHNKWWFSVLDIIAAINARKMITKRRETIGSI